MRKCFVCDQLADSANESYCRQHFNAQQYVYRERNREKVLAIHRRSRKKLRASVYQLWKDYACYKIRQATLAGTLIRPLVCEDCGQSSSRPLFAQHRSFKREQLLNVRFVCFECNAAWHRLHTAIMPTAQEIALYHQEIEQERLAKKAATEQRKADDKAKKIKVRQEKRAELQRKLVEQQALVRQRQQERYQRREAIFLDIQRLKNAGVKPGNIAKHFGKSPQWVSNKLNPRYKYLLDLARKKLSTSGNLANGI